MLCSHCGKKEVHAKGYCGCCYARYLKNGKPDRVKVKKKANCNNCGTFSERIVKGLCKKCYQRTLRHGDPTAGRKKKEKKTCSYCGEEEYLVKTLCKKCYERKRRHKIVPINIGYVKVRNICEINECENLSIAKGLCAKHYKRYQRFVVSDDYHEQPVFISTKDKTQNKRLRFSMKKYSTLLEDQNGVCAICGNGETIISKRTKKPILLSIDHCHDSGKVRGILCSKCNVAIGLFKDSTDIMRKAILYLEKAEQT